MTQSDQSNLHPLTDDWWGASNTRLTKLRVHQALVIAERNGVSISQLKEKCPPPKSKGALNIISMLEKMRPLAANVSATQNRALPKDAPDFFPTPPWATRALISGLRRYTHWQPTGTCWEPAAGAGHMVLPLRETFGNVYASDLHLRQTIRDDIEIYQANFLSAETLPEGVTSIITNPPFGDRPEKFLHKALDFGPPLIAFLLRQNCASTGWMTEAHKRATDQGYRTIRLETSTSRIPMLMNRCEKSASTSTAYSWFVFLSQKIALKQEADWECFYMQSKKPQLEAEGDYDQFLDVAMDDDPPPLFVDPAPHTLELRAE